MHIAIILDGNRRFAKKKGKKIWEGHKYGAKKVEQLIEWAKELDIGELTLYTFSIENFDRPKEEKKRLFGLFREYMKRLDNMTKKEDKNKDVKNIVIDIIGRKYLFPKDIEESMNKIIQKTKNNNGLRVNLAMGYSGRSEIVDSLKSIISKGIDKEDIDENTISENLYLKSEPDLVIRPGGEMRVSNFLIWQSSYSEWYFSPKLWPEFEKEDLVQAIGEFNKRERRFGK